MKNLLTLLFIVLVVIGCKKEAKQEEPTPEEQTEQVAEEAVITMSGEFYYDGTNAVFQRIGGDIYAVKIDENCELLASMSNAFKATKFDFTRANIKAEIVDNPLKNGWDKQIIIKDIINVQRSKTENITIQSN
ncbi:MAG: hypothetical protein HRT68_12045 [Flavobacteriaceae bacterium]|nr:hypothetical protein [Flavobacteriaceae bacterium]